jgi:hypothetical protein
MGERSSLGRDQAWALPVRVEDMVLDEKPNKGETMYDILVVVIMIVIACLFIAAVKWPDKFTRDDDEFDHRKA